MPQPTKPNEAFENMRERFLTAKRGAGHDDQERGEREEAAGAYAAENEKHFVGYAQDCVDTSTEANKHILTTQADCWRVFNEEEPLSYGFKEEWQSRIVVPKPYSAVMYGVAAVKKAFCPDFLTIEKESNPVAEAFWKETLAVQLDNRHANFVVKFLDAAVMALAVGQSMEVIPRFTSQDGLTLDLIEPWKIRRDPDAPPRDPQGGLFWVHQEWLDYHVLRIGEDAGKYHDIGRIKDAESTDPNNPMMTKEAIARRKDQVWTRSKFRRMILTSEFYGTILSPGGEELLPSGKYTVAGGRLIEAPRTTPYNRLRWPGISFSALPDLLRHGGRGLVQGIISLWEAMCNTMCLYQDAFNFVVNPPTEVCTSNLWDPTDVDDWPGKKYLTKDTVTGHQVIRPTDRKDPTGSVLANMQFKDQLFQRGSMVTDTVQGLPGYRAEITAHESAQNLDQAMGVFGLMGGNLEDGAIQVLSAIVDVVSSFASGADLFGDLSPDTQEAVMGAGGTKPSLNGRFSISGLQELLRQADTIRYLTTVIFPMAESQRFGPYIKPYNALKSFEARTNLKDENLIVSEDEAKAIDQAMAGGGPDENTDPPDTGGGPAPLSEQEKRGPKVQA